MADALRHGGGLQQDISLTRTLGQCTNLVTLLHDQARCVPFKYNCSVPVVTYFDADADAFPLMGSVVPRACLRTSEEAVG